MARVLAHRKNKLTYWLVFFDGEEALGQWSPSDSLYGSRHLAENLAAQGTLKRVKALILVDMVDDRHLDILRESNSTPWLSDLVFNTAAQLGYGRYFSGGTFPVEDDHAPFMRNDVPALDIIDLTPFTSYHHTARDTLDKCSPESLAVVGQVVMETLLILERRIGT
jgi:Zn-dependent M28 family amino/carboxypeptidase